MADTTQNALPSRSHPIKTPATANPALLLNPKAFKAQKWSTPRHNQPAQDSPVSSPSSASEAKRHDGPPPPPLHDQPASPPADHQPRSNNMLEGLYGAESRQNRPQKRKRTQVVVIDDDDQDDIDPSNAVPEPKRAAFHHKGTGIIGDYMREGRQSTPGTDLPDPVSRGNHADEVVFLGEKNQGSEKVVYGLLDATVQADKYPRPVRNLAPNLAQGFWPTMNCRLVRDASKGMTIKVIDPSDIEFGRLIPQVSQPLALLMDTLGDDLRTQPRLIMRQKGPRDWPGQPCSELMRMMINLYGPRKDAERVGKSLGQENLWLRQPSLPDRGYPLLNPHCDRNESKMARLDLSGSIHVATDSRTHEEAVTAVSKLFDNNAGNRVALPMYDTPSLLTTPLLDHQRQALAWMRQQERPRTFGDDEADNSSLWRKERNDLGAIRYREVVAQIETPDEPPQMRGGLLADVMGLGKTIETLALLVATKDEAERYGQEKMVRKPPDDGRLVRQTKSTLLVAPVSAVKNWEDQVKEHCAPGGLACYVYHGTSRTQNVYELCRYDMVVTTYGTLAADFAKGPAGVLHRLRWFRVVLDEAHVCREAKSQQAKAAFEVQASRRWALTGTPIQNRLDDLGSITRFLQLVPYHTPHGFAKYIRSPALAGNDAFLKSLRVFVDSFSLRRLKDRVDLPPREDVVCQLQFSDPERRLHDFFRQAFDVEAEEMVERDLQREQTTTALKKKKKQQRPPTGSGAAAAPSGGYIRVLQGILTLRLICAHGKELLGESSRQMLQGRSRSEAIELDDGPAAPAFGVDTAYDTLAMMASADMDSCRECLRRIGGDSPPDEDGDPDPVRGYMLPCNDLLCKDCFGPQKAAFDQLADATLRECPFCEMTVRAEYVAITTDGLTSSRPSDRETAVEPRASKAGDDPPTGPGYGGPHTKTKALLEDLDAMREESRAHVARGEAPIKAVVFSEFTSHLDLIERALQAHGHGDAWVRIDGTMTLARRRKVLDALSTDDSVTVLLASIKAAGQGLNLTAASRAFIMEPMWNPAAEQQAVDRVHRLGQRRPVRIKRYQMADSIESKIVQIQRKKIHLAEVSMERNHDKLSRKEERVMHMKDLLGMFK